MDEEDEYEYASYYEGTWVDDIENYEERSPIKKIEEPLEDPPTEWEKFTSSISSAPWWAWALLLLPLVLSALMGKCDFDPSTAPGFRGY